MISAIILAAGLSRRMGRPKLLLKLGAKTLIEHVVDTALMSQAGEVIVVLGAYQQEITSLLKDRPVQQVVNDSFDKGQGTSVACGTRAANRDASGLMFMLSDQPFICAQTINQLITKFQSNNMSIIQPKFGNRPGNPCIFSASLRGELEKLGGESGGKSIINKYAQQVLTVPFPEGPEGLDADNDADYQNLKLIWNKMGGSLCLK